VVPLLAMYCQHRGIDNLQAVHVVGAVHQIGTVGRAVTHRHEPVVGEGSLDKDVPLLRYAVLEMAVELIFTNPVDRWRRGIGAHRDIQRLAIEEVKCRHAGRIQAVGLLHRAAGETAGAIIHRAREITAVARQVGDTVSTTDDRVLGHLVCNAKPRSPVVVHRVPKIAAVTARAGEDHGAQSAEGILGRQVYR